MSRRPRIARLAWQVCAASAGLLLAAGAASALQKTLKSKAHNYAEAPVTLRRPQVTLVETYTSPSQFVVGDAKAKTTRVRYANRAGLSPSVFMLKGEVQCANGAPQPVEAVSLTIVALDAFHQPVDVSGAGGALSVRQVAQPIARGGSARIVWEETVRSPDVYEVAVIVTRVRFADGTVWTAPAEELLDLF
jgi:hypothetical protein